MAGQDSAYPVLASLLDGYLHQDFRAEYGSAREAALAYIREATPANRALAGEEVGRLRSSLAGRPLSEWRAAMLKIGGAWWPRSMREVEGVLALLESHPNEPG